MSPYTVVISPKAQDELGEIRDYVAARSNVETADAYIGRISRRLLELDLFPEQGSLPPDGSRTFGFEGSVTIHFIVRPKRRQVRILGVLYRGRRL